MKSKEVYNIIIRYVLLLILAIPNLYLFYLIFTPLTVFPVYTVLNALYGAELLPNNVIFFQNFYAELIPACIAGAAYYFLLLLNLTTPMPIKKRIHSIMYLFAAFLILNIIRIVSFAALLTAGFQYFDLTHKFTWYFGSTFLLVLIWFSAIYIFKIKNIPVYTDFNNIYKETKKKKRKRKHK